MKKLFLLIGFLLFVFPINVIAQEIKAIKKIAILPADVRIIDKTKKLDSLKIYKAELSSAFLLQAEINNWFEINRKKFKDKIAIQDLATTNELVFADKRSLNQFRNLTKDSLAKILGVDIVLFSNAKITGDETKLTVADHISMVTDPSLLNIYGTLDDVGTKIHKINIEIGFNNTGDGNPVWQKDFGPYNNGLDRLYFIVKRILKKSAKHIPY